MENDADILLYNTEWGEMNIKYLLLFPIIFCCYDFILHCLQFFNVYAGPFLARTLSYKIFWTIGWGIVLLLLCVIFFLIRRVDK